MLTIPYGARDTYAGERFNRDTLTELFKTFKEFDRAFLIPGEREMIGVFNTSKNGR